MKKKWDYFFLTSKNEIYINIEPQKQVDPSAQGVLRRPIKVYKRVQKTNRKNMRLLYSSK
jgi:hypothetical protein